MSTIGTTLFSQIEINGQIVDIATLDANNGLYQLPAGYTDATVKYTMINNTYIPNGVFEENTYITGVKLAYTINDIASYSFHGVTNINLTDKNAILAINPYAFDAEPQPVVKQNIPTTAVEPIVLSSDKGGTTQNKNVLKIAEYNPSANYLDTSYWTITSSNTDFVIQGVSITPSGSMEYYKVNCEFSVPQATSMSQTTDLVISFIGNDDYNPGTWTQYVTLEAETPQKQYPTANWEENGNVISNLILVEGGSSTHTLTFDATPSDSWNFMDPMVSGVSVDTTTGTVIITESSLIGSSNISISASRMEDASYYYGNATLSIRVLPAGSDPQFFYDQSSINLDSQGISQQTPMLNNTTGIAATPTYQSSDTSIATVDSMGTISYVGVGNTTVTATITDGVNTHTATINVYCTQNKYYAQADWSYNGMTYYGTIPVVEPFTGTISLINRTPSDGWVLTDPMVQGITVDNNSYLYNVSGLTQGIYYPSASRDEDSQYYYSSSSLELRVLPSGSNPNFYYDQSTINLDNLYTTTMSPTLINNTGLQPTFSSNNTDIATVDNYGVISYVSVGMTSVVATVTDGNDSYYTYCGVICSDSTPEPTPPEPPVNEG